MEQNGGNLKLFYQIKEAMIERIYFEKTYIEQIRYNTSSGFVLLYVDEKGPVTADSWEILVISTGKGSESQKIRGLLNVFGAYDHTNDRSMYIVIEIRQGNSLLTF